MNDWNILHNPLFKVDFATRIYMAFVLTSSPCAYLTTQPMSTLIYLQVFGVDILPSLMNTITDIIFKLRDRNYSVRFHNCAHYVADTPKNLHPNTLGNHVEIHFKWHINSSLVFGSLISDVTCNYVSADGGRDGLWWPALPGHWLSYTGCWL